LVPFMPLVSRKGILAIAAVIDVAVNGPRPAGIGQGAGGTS
jgi:hypothetical protein